MLQSLAGVMIVVNILYLALRFGDIILSGKTGMMFTSGFYSVVFWIEIALFVAPIVMFTRSRTFSTLLTGSMLLILAGAMYRFDAYLTAFNPGPNWNYFPNLPELLITLGVIALEIALYIFIVKKYPILGGASAVEAAK